MIDKERQYTERESKRIDCSRGKVDRTDKEDTGEARQGGRSVCCAHSQVRCSEEAMSGCSNTEETERTSLQNCLFLPWLPRCHRMDSQPVYFICSSCTTSKVQDVRRNRDVVVNVFVVADRNSYERGNCELCASITIASKRRWNWLFRGCASLLVTCIRCWELCKPRCRFDR